MTNKITEANAGGPRLLPLRTRRAARGAQFWRSAATVTHLSIMRTVFTLLSIGVIALAGCFGPSEGPQHVFQLKEAPQLLTEELAVAKATETFTKEGYKMEQWQLTRAGNPPSKAPDGTPDKCFDRFSFRPTEGRVHFTDGKRYRTVQVRLEGDRLVCFMFYGP
jgi:hypothetical protein